MSRRSYTKELLEQAAKCCTDIDEVIAFFGTRPYGHVRRHLYRRFAHFGIDVSHFSRPRARSTAPPPAESELREAVAASVSIAGVLRALGRSDGSRTRKAFHEQVAAFGIDTSHFLGQAHQRGRPGTAQRRPPEEVLVKHSGTQRTRTTVLRVALRAIGVPEQCAVCGTGPWWHGRPMTLEIDHINGDWHDDRAENLRFLCPNCHAVTDTWCGRKSGRVQQSGTMT